MSDDAKQPASIEYARPADVRRRPHRLVILAGSITALVLSAVVASPFVNRSRVHSNYVQCANNLRQIGLAMQMYMVENNGVAPDRLETIFLTQDLTPHVFVCPASGAEHAPGDTPERQAAELATLDHCSYFYLRPSSDTPPKSIVAYELPAKHDGRDGMWVLFADGRVAYLEPKDSRKLLGVIATGARPVIWPPPRTQPAVGP